MAMLIGTAIIAGISGYMIGIASSLGFLPIPFLPKTVARERGLAGVKNYDDEEESEEEDIDEAVLIDHAPNWANGVEADRRDGLKATAVHKAKTEELNEVKDTGEECKLVLVVRTDLGMTKGISRLSHFSPFYIQPQIQTQADPFSPHRQNCRPMRSRNLSLLQALPCPLPQLPHFAPLGATRPSQGRAAS